MSKKKKIVISFILLLITVLLIIYFSGVWYFRSHFLANTFINNTDYGFKSFESVSEDIEKDTEKYILSIRFRNGEKASLTARQIGYRGTDNGAHIKVAAKQNPYKWMSAFFSERREVIGIRYIYNEIMLNNSVNNLEQMDTENMEEPEDAYVKYSEEEKRFIIVPETEGTTIRKDKFMESVRKSLEKGEDVLDAEKEGVYEKADVRSDSDELLEYVGKMNKYLDGKITYLLPDGETLVLDGERVCQWFAEDENGNKYYDEDVWNEHIVEFVDELAVKVNTVWKDKEFESTDDGLITVQGGTYGYSVDKESEAESINDVISNGGEEERSPRYYTAETGDPDVNDGIGSTYIEVSIDEQHLWYYEDGEMVMDSPVVTGNKGNHDTPKGIFTVMFTQHPAVLRGRIMSNGEPEYESPVSYWMPFYDGCGFHDATWRGSFGGSIYTYNGSHGCVNMPYSAAQELFEYVDGGTVVVIY